MVLAEESSVGLVADGIIVEDIHAKTYSMPVGRAIDTSDMEGGDEEPAVVRHVGILESGRTSDVQAPFIREIRELTGSLALAFLRIDRGHEADAAIQYIGTLVRLHGASVTDVVESHFRIDLQITGDGKLQIQTSAQIGVDA